MFIQTKIVVNFLLRSGLRNSTNERDCFNHQLSISKWE